MWDKNIADEGDGFLCSGRLNTAGNDIMHRWTIMAIAMLCAFTTQLHAADAVSGASPSEIRVGEVTRIWVTGR